MKYARGTRLDMQFPFATYRGGVALCSDGKIRTLKRISQCADTFFSVPAAVGVKGRTVSGFVTLETMQGWQTATENDPAVVKFIVIQGRKNSHMLPSGAYRTEKIA